MGQRALLVDSDGNIAMDGLALTFREHQWESDIADCLDDAERLTQEYQYGALVINPYELFADNLNVQQLPRKFQSDTELERIRTLTSTALKNSVYVIVLCLDHDKEGFMRDYGLMINVHFKYILQIPTPESLIIHLVEYSQQKK